MATATPAAPPDAPVVSAPSGRLRAVHTRTAALGYLLAGTGMLTLVVVLALFEPEVLAGLLPIFAVIVIAGVLVWRFGTWAKVIGAIGALAFLAMFGPFMFGMLAWPYSFFDFVPAFFVIMGLLLAAGGSIAAIVQRKQQAAAATPLERAIRTWAIVLAVAAVVVSGVWTVTTWGGAAAAAEGSIAVEVEAGTFVGSPYEIPAGETVTFAVHNADPWVHTFTIPDLGVDEMLRPGASVNVEVTAPAGTYTLYCEPHANTDDPNPDTAGMAGAITAR
jgi:plastocyanin